MVEKIIIENFGGLKKLEFEFRSINVLIGPQASGKSVTVKLTYLFKTFFSEIFRSIDTHETKRQLDTRQKEKFLTYFPKESWAKGSFRIEYQINNSFILIEKKGTHPLHFDYSENLKKILTKCRSFYKEEQKKIEQEPRVQAYKLRGNVRKKFNEYLSNEISNIASYNQYFIPAGRSFFANIQSSIFSFLSDNRSLDPFLIEFGSFYENFKRFAFVQNDLSKKKKIEKEDFDDLISQILNGSYLREKDKDFLIHKDSRKVNLSNASSGQQETLPLVLVLRALTNISFGEGGATLYIEEPEAHLFPTAQKRIIQLLARTFNSIDTNFQIIVTTHSPYILSSFNNLIEAGKILEDKPSLNSKIIKIIPEEEILKPNDLIAYSLNQGEKKVLIDRTTKLISQNILDSVSDEIAIEFGKLIELT